MGNAKRDRLAAVRGLSALDLAVFQALGNPTRAQLMAALIRGGPGSAKSLGAQLDVAPKCASYHVNTLAGLGMVEHDHDEPHQGAVERFFRPLRLARLESEVLDLDEQGWAELESLDAAARQHAEAIRERAAKRTGDKHRVTWLRLACEPPPPSEVT